MMELLKEIWSTARRNKLRTSLTGFAVAWGIFMLIFLLGAGNGLINAQQAQSNQYLASSILVWGGSTSKPYQGLKEGRPIRLNDRDLQLTGDLFERNTEDVGAVISQNGVNISYGGEYVVQQTLSGVYPSNLAIDKRELLAGRFVNDIDFRERRKNIVLTESQARELHKDVRALLGRYVKVEGLAFRVVGILKDNRQKQNNEAFIAHTTLRGIYGKGDQVGSIQFAIRHLPDEESNEQFEDAYKQKLNAVHEAAPDDDNTLWIWNRFTQNIQMTRGIGMLRIALWVIGLFTLLSGIVGVSNIMLITVKERTREFGVRKAIGAKPRHILKLIIVESVITTAIFGYIGMLCGILVNEYMDATIGHTTVKTGLFEATMFLNPTVGIDVCVQATLVIILAGTIAGLIPALKAAGVRPIEALRSE